MPVVHGFSGSPTYMPEFYRTFCGSLGNNIQANFQWDQTNSNNMVIKVAGSSDNVTFSNHPDGYFEMDDRSQGTKYYETGDSPAREQFPGLEAWGIFFNYNLVGLELYASEPASGKSYKLAIFDVHSLSTQSFPNINFSNAADEFVIDVTQNSTTIQADFYIVNIGGTTVWTATPLYATLAGYTLPPPYPMNGTSAQLHGLDHDQYANVQAGTDFQITSTITQGVSDFTAQATPYYNDSSPVNDTVFSFCGNNFVTYAEDEGTDATYTPYTTGHDSSYAWQSYEVTGTNPTSVLVNSIWVLGGGPITGYYTVVKDGSGSTAGTGYTPATFSLNWNEYYTVNPQNYGGCNFDYWLDTGSNTNPRSFHANGQVLTAVYSGSC
jgi:hypothetical protein